MPTIKNFGPVQTTSLITDWVPIQEDISGTSKHVQLSTIRKLGGYDDYLFVQDVANPGGANAPALAVFRDGVKMAAFDGSNTMMEVTGNIHITHRYVPSTAISFHIHWTHNNATPSGDVKWNIDYAIAKGFSGGAFPAFTTVSLVETAGAQYTHHTIETTDISDAAIDIDSLILMRIWRDPSDVADTFADDVFFIRCDAHVQVDSRVTTGKVPPFTKV